MTQTFLITGARGLLGRHLIQNLPESKIYALVKDPHFEDVWPNHCQIIQGDLLDRNLVNKLPSHVDGIIHLAQSNHFRNFPDKALDIVGVNTISTLKLLDYARRINASHFIYASSGTVYSVQKDVCFENNPLIFKRNQGIYYTSKYASEMLVDNYSSVMTTATLRFFFIYGPGQKETMLIPRLVHSILDGKAITIQGDEGIRINPVYVSDAVNLIKASLNLNQSHTVNVAGPTTYSLKEICLEIGNLLGKEPIFDYVSNHDETSGQNLIGDIEVMKTLSPPQTSFKEGIALYIKSLELMS